MITKAATAIGDRASVGQPTRIALPVRVQWEDDVVVPGEKRSGRLDEFVATDYSWTHTVLSPVARRADAETWLRSVWEGGPGFLRWLLPACWKWGLGLRLMPMSGTRQVLGWPIVRSDPRAIVVAADSRFIRALNVLSVDGETVKWTTSVVHTNSLGRLLWLCARVIHERLVPWLVARALSREEIRSS